MRIAVYALLLVNLLYLGWSEWIDVPFGVASASLVTAFFIPDRHTSNGDEFIHGVHRAFFVLGAMTILSTIVFWELKSGDGDSVSQRTDMHAG